MAAGRHGVPVVNIRYGPSVLFRPSIAKPDAGDNGAPRRDSETFASDIPVAGDCGEVLKLAVVV